MSTLVDGNLKKAYEELAWLREQLQDSSDPVLAALAELDWDRNKVVDYLDDLDKARKEVLAAADVLADLHRKSLDFWDDTAGGNFRAIVGGLRDEYREVAHVMIFDELRSYTKDVYSSACRLTNEYQTPVKADQTQFAKLALKALRSKVRGCRELIESHVQPIARRHHDAVHLTSRRQPS